MGREDYFNLNRETEIVKKNGRIVKDNTGSPFHLHVQLCSHYELPALAS
jgi:predicted DNA-binding protein with PD1-like motif